MKLFTIVNPSRSQVSVQSPVCYAVDSIDESFRPQVGRAVELGGIPGERRS